jgi:hypothetical protein
VNEHIFSLFMLDPSRPRTFMSRRVRSKVGLYYFADSVDFRVVILGWEVWCLPRSCKVVPFLICFAENISFGKAVG